MKSFNELFPIKIVISLIYTHLKFTSKFELLLFQSQEIATEGELRIHSVDDSDKVRELQDKVADLQAEVSFQNYYLKANEYITSIL